MNEPKHLDLFSGIGGFAIAPDGLDLKQSDSATMSHSLNPFLKSTGPASQSTQTSEKFEASYTQESLFSQAGFPANHFPLLGSKEARKMTAISGRKCSELYKKQGQLGSLVKMLLESLEWHSTKCVLTWKQKATKSSRSLFQLAVSMPRIEETESGSLPETQEPNLWPTPRTQSGGPDCSAKQKRPSGHHGTTNLQGAVKMWPTPTQNGNYNQKGISKNAGDGLATAVRMWPTASARDWKDTPGMSEKGKDGRNRTDQLARKVYQQERMWPTPKANKVHPMITEENREKLANSNKSNLEEVIAGDCGRATGQLNPNWVEWLMGYPIGWTDLKDSEMPSCRKSPTKS